MPDDIAPEPASPVPSEAIAPPVLDRRTVWGEVCAVLAVGVIPHLCNALYSFVAPAAPVAPPPPVWLDTLHELARDACIIFVTLYLMKRSGEPLARFGVDRPVSWDLPLGIGMFLAGWVLWLFFIRWMPWGTTPSDEVFVKPERPWDYAFLTLTLSVSAFTEELVTRAYLITRLEQLLKAKGAAVLWSSALFASYHCYQGSAAVVETMAVGLVYGIAFLAMRRVWPLALGQALYNMSLHLMA